MPTPDPEMTAAVRSSLLEAVKKDLEAIRRDFDSIKSDIADLRERLTNDYESAGAARNRRKLMYATMLVAVLLAALMVANNRALTRKVNAESQARTVTVCAKVDSTLNVLRDLVNASDPLPVTPDMSPDLRAAVEESNRRAVEFKENSLRRIDQANCGSSLENTEGG